MLNYLTVLKPGRSFTTCCMPLSKQGFEIFGFTKNSLNNQRSFLRDVFSFFEQRLGSIKKRLLILSRLRALVLNTPTTKFSGGIATLLLTIETSQKKPREANKTMIAIGKPKRLTTTRSDRSRGRLITTSDRSSKGLTKQ